MVNVYRSYERQFVVSRLIPMWTTRRESLDHMLFFNGRDLQKKLDRFQAYYNDVRAHSSLDMKTPRAMAFGVAPDEKVVSIDRYRWKKHCNGLYELPVAA